MSARLATPKDARAAGDPQSLPINDSMHDRFKNAMAGYPAGVVVATTLDVQGDPQGFTATSFSSLSLDPPTVLVCLARSARCHPHFVKASHFVINILGAADAVLALQFANSKADKWRGVDTWRTGQGVPVLAAAAAHIECVAQPPVDSGDHTILIGRVIDVQTDARREALVHYRRTFGRVLI